MKRSRSGQRGSAGSNFMNFENSTVATSAMPIGKPGWPESACCTASMARALMALARSREATDCSVILFGRRGGFRSGAHHDGGAMTRQCQDVVARLLHSDQMLTAHKRSTYS